MESKKNSIPTVSRTVLVPDPMKGPAQGRKQKIVSISDSVLSSGSESEMGNGHHHHPSSDGPPKSRLRRCRKRLSTLLHTHVALILVSTMAALDASFVIGQIICDILIMKNELQEWEELDTSLTPLLASQLRLNDSNLNLNMIKEILLAYNSSSFSSAMSLSASMHTSIAQPPAGLSMDSRLWQALHTAAVNVPESQVSGTLNVSVPGAPGAGNSTNEMVIGFFRIPLGRSKRSATGHVRASGSDVHEEHDLLHDLTHSFHLGSMIILSMLLAETLLKVFAMGRKVLHHKLEIFDAFVVSVSWALDVAFWEGIWAHPGTKAATILIIILPWRVVRIVNSFVLVIQEKDHVQLKIVKQRLRMSMKKSKESTRKASSYRTEVKQLQGLCRKYGATENEINACCPTGRMGRRRSSLLPAMERVASLTLISALGSHPSLYTMGSSSEDEGDVVSRKTTLRSALSVSTLDSVFTIEGKGDFDPEEQSMDGLDNPVFQQGGDDDSPTPSSSTMNVARDAELGHVQLSRRLHARLVAQDSNASVVSETGTVESGSSGGDPSAQDIPPHYHEVVAKQDSNTRL